MHVFLYTCRPMYAFGVGEYLYGVFVLRICNRDATKDGLKVSLTCFGRKNLNSRDGLLCNVVEHLCSGLPFRPSIPQDSVTEFACHFRCGTRSECKSGVGWLSYDVGQCPRLVKVVPLHAQKQLAATSMVGSWLSLI